MPARKTAKTPAPTTLELPSVLDVRAAGPLYGSLLALRGRSVRLEAGQVQRVGGQCLQVLLAAAAAWRADGVAFGFGAVSAAARDGLALLGVSADELSMGTTAR